MSVKTVGTRSHLTVVNADPTNAVTASAVIAVITAEASRRPHLIDSILTIQWAPESGVGVLTSDAGTRQHLANALAFDPQVFEGPSTKEGQAYHRTDYMLDVHVNIWNVEP